MPVDTIPGRSLMVNARLAGALYALIVIAGLTSELALRGPLLNGHDPAAALAANMSQFRASMLGDLLMVLADIALALVFFGLLRPIDETLARAAMVFRLMQAALIGMGLVLLTGVPMALPRDPALALHLTAMHAAGYDIGLIFFGVNSLIMARLLILSGGVPRLIALGIGASGLVYIAGGLARVAAPDLQAAIQPAYLIPMLSETALALWLLIRARI